jgi:hypothetical protein
MMKKKLRTSSETTMYKINIDFLTSHYELLQLKTNLNYLIYTTQNLKYTIYDLK